MKTSKILEKIAKLNPKYIDYYYCDSDGHWMHTTSGFIFPDSECGTLHEWSVKDMLEKIKYGIEKGEYENGFSSPIPNAKRIKLKIN